MADKTYRLPRRAVVAQLREVKRYLGLLVDSWSQSQTIVSSAPDEHGVAHYRWLKRTEAQKIENDPQAWIQLDEWARSLATNLLNLADFATEQAAEARKRSQS